MYPIAFSYVRMIQTLNDVSTNFEKQQQYTQATPMLSNNYPMQWDHLCKDLMLQCCPISNNCNETSCARTWCIARAKIRTTFIHCVRNWKQETKKREKLKKKMKKFKPNSPTCQSHNFGVHLQLSYVTCNMLPMDGVLVVVGYFGPASKRLSLNKCANYMIPCLIYARTYII